MIFAFKANVSALDQDTMNSLIQAQNTVLIYQGTLLDSVDGAGVFEHDLATYEVATRFRMVGDANIGRIAFEFMRYGAGADLIIEIRGNQFSTDGSNDGTLHKTVKFPAKLFKSSYTYESLPIDLSGLTAGAYYWLIIRKAGDSTNHLRIRGESVQDAGHPTYRRTSAGAWTATNVPHFRVYSNTTGDGEYRLRHTIYGENAKTTIVYTGDGYTVGEIWRWISAPDGTFVIVDKYVPTYDENGVSTRWEVQAL